MKNEKMTSKIITYILIASIIFVLIKYLIPNFTITKKTNDNELLLSLHNAYHTNGSFVSTNKSVINAEGIEQSFQSILNKDFNLIFIYDTKDCDICVLEELQYCNLLGEKIGNDYISAIFQASNSKYLKIYKKRNNVKFPLYQDCDGSFLKDLPIITTPVLLFIDEKSQIINSFYPIKGRPELSKPFYQYIEHKIKAVD